MSDKKATPDPSNEDVSTPPIQPNVDISSGIDGSREENVSAPLVQRNVDISSGIDGSREENVSAPLVQRNDDISSSIDGGRERTKTAKGLSYNLELFYKQRKKLQEEVMEKICQIEQLMRSTKHAQRVQQELSCLDKIIQDFSFVNEKYRVLLDDEEYNKDEPIGVNMETEVFLLKQNAIRWLQQSNIESEGSTSRRSTKSSRKSSSRSTTSRSSMKEKMLEEALELASLKAESSFKRERKLTEEEILAESMEIAKGEARMEIYKTFIADDQQTERKNVQFMTDQNDNGSIVDVQFKLTPNEELLQENDYASKFRTHPDTTTSNHVKDAAKIPKPIPNYSGGEQNTTPVFDFGEKLCELLKLQAAPTVELESFDGNPLNYRYFITAFEEVVQKKVSDPRGQLMRLIQYTTGEAKELIKGSIHNDVSNGYIYARQLLEKRFGDPHRILGAYRKELKQWNQLKPGDAAGFRNFYAFLIKCSSIVKGQFWNTLDSPDNLCAIIMKLPIHSRDKWNRKALNLRSREFREPQLSDLIAFVDEECVLANDPLFSREALNNNLQNVTEKMESRGKPVKTFLSQLVCPLCAKNHDLDFCPTFKIKNLKEKNKWIMKNRLCFGCYGKDHIASHCTRRRTCKTCGGKHPTALHGYLPREEIHKKEEYNKTVKTNVTNMHVNSTNVSTVSMSIVPVLLRHDQSTKDVLTYALLDSCSQGTFIDEDLIACLEVEGIHTEITVKTLTGEDSLASQIINGLMVKGANGEDWIHLPKTYTRSNIPINDDEIPTPHKLKPWSYLSAIADELSREKNVKVGLLIGANCPAALEPQHVIPSQDGGPFAVKTLLGWCVVGPILPKNHSSTISCHHISINNEDPEDIASHQFVITDQFKEINMRNMLQRLYDVDRVKAVITEHSEVSQEDLKFIEIMKSEVGMVNGHYQLPLPFRDANIKLPNNRGMAVKRAESLKRKFIRNPKFHEEYTNFITGMLMKGHARLASSRSNDGKNWFIPHHGVYHPSKGKIRVVFDCSAECNGTSLNKSLMQGPDLTNQLVGVLTRFRQERIAIMADIEAMFYQVSIPEEQRCFVRFLWWPDGDYHKELVDHEMCVHIFGGTSSPSCSNFALRQAAKDGGTKHGSEASCTLEKNFYVDDLLKSMEDPTSSIKLIKNVSSMCADGGFRLTKFISNSEEVMNQIPVEDRRKVVQSYDLLTDESALERALGVQWCIQDDVFTFHINMKNQPSTRRGLLSAVSSIYDPLGLVAPFILPAKKILQKLCHTQLGWDDPIPEDVLLEWERWKSTLPLLKDIRVSRCLKPKNFGNIKETSLHHFSDASDDGYGQCSYVRLVNENGMVHCALLMAKSRVSPMKPLVSIPRLELIAATLSAQVAKNLCAELEYDIDYQVFWTDSQVVLGYINNDAKRFKIFVANRITLINQLSSKDQWRYVSTKENPADLTSRGLQPKQVSKIQLYLNGPDFLYHDDIHCDKITQPQVNPDDKELRASKNVYATKCNPTDNSSVITHLEQRISSWSKMKRVVAYVRQYINKLKSGRQNRHSMQLRCQNEGLVELTVDDISKAQTCIISMLQQRYFKDEIESLQVLNKGVKQNSTLAKLDPFIDQDGVIRVGGRLKHSHLEYDLKHPAVIPKESKICVAIIRWHHESVKHAGRGITINEIRDHGIWIMNINTVTRSIIWNCVGCRRLRGKHGVQLMSDLPVDRLEAAAPFTYCGIDLFGPFHIKDRRSEVKRYGVMFTCLSCRAIHLESTNSMETDTFIMALRRFMNRRGVVRLIRSDNGSNFIGAQRELKREFERMDHAKIGIFMQNKNADWITWKNNPPYASHFGGVWERQIRSARSILNGILLTHSKSLNDEAFRTILTEVECVVNSRPLTVDNLSDPCSLKPLTPSTLLTLKSKVVPPPPGAFSPADVYSRKYWRRTQHLVNEFWVRWRKEFLNSLQERKKWTKKSRNLQVGDVVLLKTEEVRNNWPMAMVQETFPDQNGLVRSAKICMENSILHRPISKLILLVETENINVDSPPKEPLDQDSIGKS